MQCFDAFLLAELGPEIVQSFSEKRIGFIEQAECTTE